MVFILTGWSFWSAAELNKAGHILVFKNPGNYIIRRKQHDKCIFSNRKGNCLWI